MTRLGTWIAGGTLALCLTLGAAVLMTPDSAPTNPECPGGKCPTTKKATPKPTQPAKPKPKPWLDTGYQTVGLVSPYPYGPDDEAAKESWVNGRESDGEVVTADFPGTLYIQNIGSHKDGAGMCVMTSITMLAHYLGLTDYYGLRDWCANEPGGAYRQKVDDQIKRYERAMGIKNPIPYLQYEGPSPEMVLESIDHARLPFAHTYGWSPRYGHRIAHMVANVHYGIGQERLSVVLDNNPMSDFDIPGGKFLEWMPKEEMVRRAKLGQGGNMWLFAWLAPPPPPCPKVQ